MLMRIVRLIPFVGSAFSFPAMVCGRALVELLVLWFLSTLPLIFSVAFKIKAGSSISDAAGEEVNIRVIFAYTSAFLAPVFYLLMARLIYPREQKIFSGSIWIFVATVTIMCFSSWLFQNDKVSIDSWRNVSFVMYLLSIYFWWLAISDDRNNTFAYEAAVGKDEDAFAKEAEQRRRGGTNG
jgi:hypothetical protein